MDGSAHAGEQPFLARIARQACNSVEVDDVAITRFSAPAGWDVAHATSEAVGRVEQLAFTVGEGPMWDAWRQHRTIFVPDLGDLRARRRWPEWAAAAADVGFGAATVVPVQVGVITLGTMSLYCSEARRLTDRQLERAAALADAVLIGLLDELAGTDRDTAVPRGAATTPDTAREFFSASVYQASGMLMMQLDLDATNALLALRAHAFASERPLREVADDVVARRLRFSADGEPA